MNSITDLLHSENEYYDNQKVPGFVQGIVVENNNADFKGMVKVEFTVWETGKNMCEWVRLLSPYAGKDYGTYLVPEIDEMVLVGFIGGSLKRPFLLGSLYPSGASVVSENFDQKNLKKHLKTKGGMDLLIQEEDGKQSITLTTPKGSVIAMDDSTESCKISDKDGKNMLSMDYKNGKITIQSEKNISLKAGSAELTMDGNAGAVSLKAKKVTVTADNEFMFQRAAEAVNFDTFSGPAYVSDILSDDNDAGAPGLHYVVFDPGVINNWHTHEGGQILIATDGIGYHQIEGEPVQVMHPGDVAFCPPGVKHWHGGSADSSFAHIAVNTNPEKSGVEWFERISADEYAKLGTESETSETNN